jgi:hypothetical protein
MGRKRGKFAVLIRTSIATVSIAAENRAILAG